MTTHQMRRRLKAMSRKATARKLRPEDQALLNFHRALNRAQDTKAADEADRTYRP